MLIIFKQNPVKNIIYHFLSAAGKQNGEVL